MLKCCSLKISKGLNRLVWCSAVVCVDTECRHRYRSQGTVECLVFSPTVHSVIRVNVYCYCFELDIF